MIRSTLRALPSLVLATALATQSESRAQQQGLPTAASLQQELADARIRYEDAFEQLFADVVGAMRDSVHVDSTATTAMARNYREAGTWPAEPAFEPLLQRACDLQRTLDDAYNRAIIAAEQLEMDRAEAVLSKRLVCERELHVAINPLMPWRVLEVVVAAAGTLHPLPLKPDTTKNYSVDVSGKASGSEVVLVLPASRGSVLAIVPVVDGSFRAIMTVRRDDWACLLGADRLRVATGGMAGASIRGEAVTLTRFRWREALCNREPLYDPQAVRRGEAAQREAEAAAEEAAAEEVARAEQEAELDAEQKRAEQELQRRLRGANRKVEAINRRIAAIAGRIATLSRNIEKLDQRIAKKKRVRQDSSDERSDRKRMAGELKRRREDLVKVEAELRQARDVVAALEQQS